MALRTTFSSVSIISRVVITALVLCAIYICYGPPDYVEMDLINQVFYVLIVAPVLITGTILATLLAGTPLRANQAMFDWWYRRPYIPASGITAGIFLCKLSADQALMTGLGYPLSLGERANTIPNFYVLCTGWFLTSFSMIHTYVSAVVPFIKGEWKTEW